jgi:hypothetical protein
MQQHTLVAVAVLGVIGVVVHHRGAVGSAEPRPSAIGARGADVHPQRARAGWPAPRVRPVAVVRPALEVEPAPGDPDEDRPEAELEPAPTGNTMIGQVTDQQTGEQLAGATVLVTSDRHPMATAVTEADGRYAITGLAAGSYQVTLYYGEVTVERTNVWVTSLDPTRLDVELEPAPDPPIVISMDSSITLEPMSTVDLRGRTFEAVLGGSADLDEDPDGPGVSFTGTESIENTYVVDGVSTEGLTWE